MFEIVDNCKETFQKKVYRAKTKPKKEINTTGSKDGLRWRKLKQIAYKKKILEIWGSIFPIAFKILDVPVAPDLRPRLPTHCFRCPECAFSFNLFKGFFVVHLANSELILMVTDLTMNSTGNIIFF